MSDEQHDDPLDELRTALAVDPAPAFAARVGSAVAAGDHRWRVVRRMQAVGMAGVIIAAGATWVVRVERRHPVEAFAVRSTVVSPALRPAPGPTPAVVATVQSERPVVGRVVAQALAVTAGPVEPEVLVPDDQRQALNHLLARLRAGMATLPPVVAPTVDEEGFLAPLPPVAVPPLSEPALLAPGGDPGKDKSW